MIAFSSKKCVGFLENPPGDDLVLVPHARSSFLQHFASRASFYRADVGELDQTRSGGPA
jgi:hypothetical protein